MAWVKRDFEGASFQLPCHGLGYLSQTTLICALSSLALKLRSGICDFILYLWRVLSLFLCPGCTWCICANCQLDFQFQLLAGRGCMKNKGTLAKELNNWVPWLPVFKQKSVLNLCSDFFIRSMAQNAFLFS